MIAEQDTPELYARIQNALEANGHDLEKFAGPFTFKQVRKETAADGSSVRYVTLATAAGDEVEFLEEELNPAKKPRNDQEKTEPVAPESARAVTVPDEVDLDYIEAEEPSGIIAEKETALRQAPVAKQSEATIPDVAIEEKIEKQPIPVINPEIAPIIENIERDVSLQNIDPDKLEAAIFHSGSGFTAKGTSQSDVLDRTINYEGLDSNGKQGFEQLTRKNKIISIYYGIGTNIHSYATEPSRSGGNFGTALENIPDDVSVHQKVKLAGLIKQTMLEVINSNEFISITTTGDKKGILVRGNIPDEDVIKFKGLIANVIKEYQASYEKMHSDAADTKTEAASEVAQPKPSPSQEVAQEQEKETSLESGPTLQEKIEKLVDFIEHSPDIKFVVGARGNVLGTKGGPSNGHEDFFYNNSSKQMEKTESNLTSLDDISFQPQENDRPKETIPGVPELNIFFKGNNAFILKRLPFRNTGKRTDILRDLRAGNHLSQALVYDKRLAASIKDPVLKELLGNPDFNVIVPALEMYTQKYARDYYNFVQECLGKDPVPEGENTLDEVRAHIAQKKETPQQAKSETVVGAAGKIEQDENSIEGWEKKYVPFPDVRGFWWNQEKDILDTQDPAFSAYELFIDPKDPTKAKFRFVDGGNGPKTNPTIQNFDVTIESVANIVEINESGDRIVQKELGEAKLSPDGTKWEVTKKPDVAIVGPEGFDFNKKEA
jgi:hypothetical protein